MKKFYLFCLRIIFIFMVLVTQTQGAPAPAHEVFKLKVYAIDPNTFALEWNIKDRFFLYKQRIKVTADLKANFDLGKLKMPASLEHKNAQERIDAIYRNKLIMPVSVLGIQAGEGLIELKYQGCADDGFCYPPQNQLLKLSFDPSLALTGIDLEDKTALISPEDSKSTQLEYTLVNSNLVLVMLIFFGLGLLLSCTPCVLPMVPILSGIIVGHGKDLSAVKAFCVSLSYVLSMALSYAVLGIVIAALGSNLQIIMQAPWVIGFFSLVFILLALSMFGLYELRLPQAFQLTNVNRYGGSYLGAAIMGCLSMLIVSPCVTAPLIGVLAYISQSKDMVRGGLALFFLGLGMGSPLLLIGTSLAKILPKAGAWMQAIKCFFGLMLLAMALYLMERILVSLIIMILWSGLFICSGIYLWIVSRIAARKLFQALALLSLAYGALILIGAAMGHDNPWRPLSFISNQDQSKQAITSLSALKQKLKILHGKPVLLDFYANWCESCKYIAKTTLKDPRVLKVLQNFAVLTIDLSANDANARELLSYYAVVAPPTFMFFDADGKSLDKLRLVGEVSAQDFVNNLRQALG